MDATLVELCFTHAHLHPPAPPFWVEAPHSERFHTQLSFHPSSSSSHSLPVFPLMSPAPPAPIRSRTLHLHLPSTPHLHRRSSLSRLFACQLIPTPGYSPADERWGSGDGDVHSVRRTLTPLRLAVCGKERKNWSICWNRRGFMKTNQAMTHPTTCHLSNSVNKYFYASPSPSPPALFCILKCLPESWCVLPETPVIEAFCRQPSMWRWLVKHCPLLAKICHVFLQTT